MPLFYHIFSKNQYKYLYLKEKNYTIFSVIIMPTIEETLLKLSKSKFRSSFTLKEDDIAYINKKGLDVIRSHSKDFVKLRLAPAQIPNDGKQTPTKGHPVFKAQHACACCCRGCLEKWYKIPKGKELTPIQQEKIVNLLMAWIEKQVISNR